MITKVSSWERPKASSGSQPSTNVTQTSAQQSSAQPDQQSQMPAQQSTAQVAPAPGPAGTQPGGSHSAAKALANLSDKENCPQPGQNPNSPFRPLKLVTVGDGAVGKVRYVL